MKMKMKLPQKTVSAESCVDYHNFSEGDFAGLAQKTLFKSN